MSQPAASVLDLKIGTRKVSLETGRIARQANAAILVREDQNVVLVTAVGARESRPGASFFPLTVEYREHMAAGGRIPGSRQRREGRISDREILACRLIDRSLRPLFPADYTREVQVQANVFSATQGSDLVSLALIGACAALHLSDIPFRGPVLGSRSVIYRDRTVLLPVRAECEEATADLFVSVGPEGLVMAEGEAQEIPEEELLDHLVASQEALDRARVDLDAWRNEAGKQKMDFAGQAFEESWREQLEEHCGAALEASLRVSGKVERATALDEVLSDHTMSLEETAASDEQKLAAPSIFRALLKERMRQAVVTQGERLDGRGTADIRPIWGEHGWLPRPHGSALFSRGETQALVTCTLGSERDMLPVETVQGPESERFILHYNFPPYSVGETRPLRGPGRREIGHGNLACRALERVLPDFEEFPYTIRIESEITESNGSSSMATVCGGCLALMDAGVPIRRTVAGIAMGLIKEGDEIAILSDILGDEDHLGDMDFKVAATELGVTALQLDNKIGGLTKEILARSLAQARDGIDSILGCMSEILAEPSDQLSPLAPHVQSLRIQPHLIGSLIGPRPRAA
ncbi:MAG: polyribonucleotide nucleotidyltransferase [Planctomycetota bacterium]